MKARFIFPLLFTCCLSVSAQSLRSKELYEQGVSQYRSSNYQQALTSFLTVDSLDKQELGLTASQHIGAADKWVASCFYRMGQTGRARQINPKTYDLQPTDRRDAQECDSIYMSLLTLVSQKRYADALPLASQLQSAMRHLYKGENYNTVVATQLLASIQYLQDLQPQAVRNFALALTIAEQLFGTSDRHFALLMANSGTLKWSVALYDEALRDIERSDSILIKAGELQRDEISYYKQLRKLSESYRTNHPAYEALLDRIPSAVRRAYTKGTEDYDDAFQYGYEIPMHLHIHAVLGEGKDTIHARVLTKRLLDKIEHVHGRYTPQYYENLDNLSYCYQGDYMTQDSINELRLQVAGQTFKKGSDEYKEALDNYEYEQNISIISSALYRHTHSDTLRTRPIALKYMSNMERIWGKENEHYYKALEAYSECFDFYDIQALPIREQLLQIAISVYGKDSEEALDAEEHLSNMGRYGHDLEYALSHASMKKENLMELADIHSEYGNYQRSNQIWKSVLDNLFKEGAEKKVLDNETMERLFYHLAVSYNHMGCRDSLTYVMLPYLLSPVLSDSLSLLYAFKTVYSDNGENHIRQFFDTLVTTRPAVKDMLAYPHRYAIMAKAIAKNNPQKAIAQIDSIEVWWQHHGGVDDIRRHFLAKQKVKVYNDIDTTQALYWYRQSQAYLRQIPDYKNMYEYFFDLASSANIAVFFRDFDRARSLIKEFRSYNKSQPMRFVYEWPELSRPYMAKTENLGYIPDISHIELPVLLHDKQWERAQRTVKEVVQTYSHTLLWTLLDDFSNSQNADSDIASYVLNQTCLLAAASNNQEDIGMAYDAALLGKQIYLNSQHELQQFIELYGDQRTKDKLELLKQVRIDLNRAQDAAEADSLSVCVIQLEKQVVSDSQRSGDFTKRLLCSWKDVQAALRDGEVAIEYVTYVLQPDTLYAALMIKPGQVAPKIVSLPSLPALSDSLLTPSGTYHALWQPVLASVEGASIIYFSPMGILHQSPVESAVDDDGRCISEQYSLYRLSSTRQLTKRNDKRKDARSIVLYGGINYDDEPTETVSAFTTYQPSFSQDEFNRMRAACNGFSYLPGTLSEIHSVSSIVKEAQYNATLLSGSNATEHSFASMSSHSPRIIHVATHGFYVGQDDIQGLATSFVSTMRESAEDKMLSSSGLLFSGASRTLDALNTKSSDDDGILTARELSRLDLDSTELVVLSACETALGNVTNDGVFGLQRGFKKAGAQSILMSLWKVDDEATCLLMTEFYKHWIGEKMSKHDALEKAKQTVRFHKEKGWDDPKYWAAFILLDGLD